jgi:ribosomal protein S18 acetylase RimI-like enzyme
MDDDPFLGWGLRAVELTDRDVLTPYFTSLAEPLSDYTFSQLFTWRNSLRILWKKINGHLCVFANGTGDLTLLLPPIGDTGGDRALSAAFELMDAYNAEHGVPHKSRVEYASDELLSRFDRRGLVADPMGFDYVYDVNRMIDLPGGDLASKRQAKNRFLRNYQHRVEPYCAQRHLAGCRQLLEQWKAHQDTQHVDEAGETGADAGGAKRLKEATATDLCLESAQALGIRGLVVYVRGGCAPGEAVDAAVPAGNLPLDSDGFAIRGFTFGEYVGRDQSSITIEKTDLTVKGLAQFIFSEFCRSHWADRPLVNVGDDWGLETLAWTKMSYRPVKLLQKYMLHRQPIISAAIPAPAQPGDPTAAHAMPRLVGARALPVTVRVADKQDVTAAVELERACFSPSVSLKKRQLQYLQQRRSAVFLVAEQGGAVIGEGIALLRQHKTGLSGRIYSLAVDSRARGQKIGDQLLSAMLQALVSRGARRVYLEVEQTNTAALRLYERHGFRRIGTLPDYYGKGKDGSHMMIQSSACKGVAEEARMVG